MDFNPRSSCKITGIIAGWDHEDPVNRRPVRREIDEWFNSGAQKDRDQVYLFVTALTFWQRVNQAKKLSYFQVAGIHGQPLESWDEETESETPGKGYCCHNSVLFPTRHRPYILLCEQIMHEVMKKEVIPKSSWDAATKARLDQDADAWRLPYWDWAAKQPDRNTGDYKVPVMTRKKLITIHLPNGQTDDPWNPMYSFRNGRPFSDFGINQDAHEGDNAFGKCQGTSRWAKSVADQYWLNGIADYTKIVDAIRAGQTADWTQNINGLSDAVYRLFTKAYVSNYAAFATTAWIPEQGSRYYMSLEGIHNKIHTYSGGYPINPKAPAWGHMTRPSVAAFDPIFWIHHCNVDRLLAIWQALFSSTPDHWFNPAGEELQDNGTWAIKPGAKDRSDTPLAPFHKDNNGTSFSSDDVRACFPLGYTYPELQPWDPKHQVDGQSSPAKYMCNIRAIISALYDSSTDLFLSRTSSGAAAYGSDTEEQQASTYEEGQTSTQVEEEASTSTTEQGSANEQDQAGANEEEQVNPDDSPEEQTHDDYVVNVLYDKFYFGGDPFTINIFFGTTKVGDVYNFSDPPNTMGGKDGDCENCNTQIINNTLATGQVPITRAIWNCPAVNELDKNNVKEFLINRLCWTVVKHDGEEVFDGDLDFIKVSVAQGKGTYYRDDERLTEFRDYEVIHDIIDNKFGGLRRGETV